MAVPFSDAILNNPALMNPVPVKPQVVRGSLITFNYLFHKPGHDPWPLVLVTDENYKGAYVRGCNLHYLTFPVIKRLLFPGPGQSVCESPIMTYQYIKGNAYIKSSFRQYKKNGIQLLKKLDCQFIVNALSLSRSFDPNEIEAIRKSVREQIRRLVNPTAQEAADSGEMPL